MLSTKVLRRFSAATILLAERCIRGKRHAPTQRAGSILVLDFLGPLGCSVHLTPVFEAIKRSRPEVTVAVASRGVGIETLRHNPFIDHLIETPDPAKDLIAAARTLSRELSRRALDPECVLTGIANRRTRYLLAALWSCRGWRGGFTEAPNLYQRPLEIDFALSHLDNNLQLASLVGCTSVHREPAVFFSAQEIATARCMVEEANPDSRPLLILVTQNSGGQRTAWHTDRFVHVIRDAYEVMGYAIAYVGTEAEASAIEAIRSAAGSIGTSLAGRTSISVLAALLAMSDAVVTLDTGTMHVGRAVGVPMVVLGPSWQKPLEWLPLGVPNATILRGADRAPAPANYKLDEIDAEQVIETLAGLAVAYPASPSARAERLGRWTSAIDHAPASHRISSVSEQDRGSSREASAEPLRPN